MSHISSVYFCLIFCVIRATLPLAISLGLDGPSRCTCSFSLWLNHFCREAEMETKITITNCRPSLVLLTRRMCFSFWLLLFGYIGSSQLSTLVPALFEICCMLWSDFRPAPVLGLRRCLSTTNWLASRLPQTLKSTWIERS